MPKIFISYRRADSAYATDPIWDYLRRQFGDGNVFLDVGSVPFGVDFREHLKEQIAAHDVVLVIIGPQWAHMMQERASQPNDFVRIEIENALALRKYVIPVRVMGAAMPDFSALPASIQDLQWRNAAEVRRPPDFEIDCARLVQNIREYFSKMPSDVFLDSAVIQEKQGLLGARITDSNEVPMVYVPAGHFWMGSTDTQIEHLFQHAMNENSDAKEDWFVDQYPAHEVVIRQGFWLDLTPVTNESFERFVADEGYLNEEYWTEAGWEWLQINQKTGPNDYRNFSAPRQPRVGVTWYEAMAYCRWRGGRLPTEAQWEWAARGPENRLYPWGNIFDSSRVIYGMNAGGKTSEVGERVRKAGMSWVGALDMIGNVWEWCSSLYQPYPYQFDDGREDELDGSNRRVMRGASWTNRTISTLCAAYRDRPLPIDSSSNRGFRFVRSS